MAQPPAPMARVTRPAASSASAQARRGEGAVDYPAKIGRHFGAAGAHRRFNTAAEGRAELRRR